MRDFDYNDRVTRIDVQEYVKTAGKNYDGTTVKMMMRAVREELQYDGDDANAIACALHCEDVPLDCVEDAFDCIGQTPEEQAADYMIDCTEIPDQLRGYINYARFAYDCMLSGDLSWYLVDGQYVAIRGNY